MNKNKIDVYEDMLQLYIKHNNVDLVTTYSFLKQAKICMRFFFMLHLNLIKGMFCKAKHKLALQNKMWFYIIHPNNYEALRKVKEGFNESKFVSTYTVVKDIDLCVLRFYSQLFYLWKFPFIFYRLYRKHGENCWGAFHIIYSATGLYEVALRQLKLYKPQVIVFANDHSPTTRALLLAASDLSIPTAYIPHANVTRVFPPLFFDLSLLEGEHMKAVYELCGKSDSRIELIGSVKADQYLSKKNSSAYVTRIGICTNQFDEIDNVREVIVAIAETFPAIEITFRSHPSDRRDFGMNAFYPQVKVSNAFEQSAMDFILDQDMIVAGDSSIHLEAAYANVLPCYYKFTRSDFLEQDYYGFVKTGLCFDLKNKQALLDFIAKNVKSKEEVSTIVSTYNAAIGSSFEGHSTTEAIKYIYQLTNSRKDSLI